MTKKKFGIIGGDMRQVFLAKSLKKDGHSVKICGFEKLKDLKLKNSKFETIIKNSDYIILPLKITKDGETLNMPFSDLKININENLINSLKYKTCFSGIISQLKKKSKSFSLKNIFYYALREDFQTLNAEPTAEGAVKIALENGFKTLMGSKCLVAGYGRIGKILASLLKNFGVAVTATIRTPESEAKAFISGLKTINLEMEKIFDFDIIFNTIPSVIFNEKKLKKIPKNTLIIDVASSPGGIDFKAAEKLEIKAIHALELPGKYFPETAGNIIKEVLYRIIKENNL